MEYKIEKNRIYAENEQGELLAEITFPEGVKGVFCINHTYVSPKLRGKGVASKLVAMAVEEIKKQKGQIVATCSYAKQWLKRHPLEN